MAGLLVLGCDTSKNDLPTTSTPPASAATSPTSQPTIGGGPNIDTGVSISDGQVVRSAVEFPDPTCFRNWYAGGRCRQFDMAAPQDGTLNVSVLWERRRGGAPDNVDLFVVEPRGGWHVSYDGGQTESLNVSVTAGSTYHILVMSYALPQDFELRTALRVK